MSMGDAVARFVHDGDTVVIEGFTHLICFAAGHEIIRQGRRNLTLARLTPDLIYDQMIAAGCAVLAPAVARAERIVAIAPLSTLGAEDSSPGTRKLIGDLEAAVAALPQTRVIRAQQVSDAIKKARRPQLRACEGDATCLADLAGL